MTKPFWNTPFGQIATAQEGSNFIFNLSYNGSLPMTVEKVSGELPPGLILDSNTGSISGTVGYLESPKEYFFTIRLTNSDGFADGGFSILISNISPIWNNPSDLGSYSPKFYTEINFSVTDLGGSGQIFEKIAGELPPGLELNVFGKLYGIAESVTTLTVYQFTLRTLLDGTYIDKTFTITIDPTVSSSPIWLTPAGSLGDIAAGNNFSQIVLAESPQNLPITYTTTPLPVNLSLNPNTGEISGILSSSLSAVYTFTVTASSGPGSNTNRIFSLNANSVTTYTLEWITAAGNIGSIREGDKSILFVLAESAAPWIRYRLTSGSLPLGLDLDEVSGQIWGTPEEQISSDTDFSFTVEAYTETEVQSRTFILTLVNNYSAGATRVYATLYGQPKLLFNDLFNSPEIVSNAVYRPSDLNFGFNRTPKILIVENLDSPSADSIFNIMNGVRRTYLTFGKVLVGKAVINDEVIYEVLYRRIFDDSSGSAQTIDFTVPTPPVVLRPGSLTNIRNELITAFGSSGGSDNLPLWMKSEQTIGDATTIPGFVPCLEFAYVLPGKAQAIADKINASDVQLQKVFQNRVRIDRIIMEPAADASFDPKNILFDTKY